jgi:hypothetical protein
MHNFEHIIAHEQPTLAARILATSGASRKESQNFAP